METIILASGSPRRRELVELLPWEFEVITKEVDETLDRNLSVKENVKALALKKAKAVAGLYPGRLVVGADTMVCLEEQLLGKPHDEEEAFHMLRGLSGRKHRVLTGVAIVCEEKKIEVTFAEETFVKMQQLSDEEIKAYIATQEVNDKAGSYAIQGVGARYIEGIEGDYFNVVGLPVHRLYQKLSNLLKTDEK